MASNVNSTQRASGSSQKQVKAQEEASTSVNCEATDKASNTLKRNPKMELSKADLLKLLTYLEGEIQARDVVIATLKCEKMKHMLNQGQYKSSSLTDPLAALHRDGFAAPSRSIDHSEMSISENQRSYLDYLSIQHRKYQIRMSNILKDAELRHKKVIEELVLEKRKHEHDTAQGDDITYGLEKERTRLKQDLENERQAKKRLEKDFKKLNDVSDEDKNRQKQIVLLLLAERKKIVMKYIEERKRSEDLAQILSEEKSRIDSMAEGLEEESKKSLQMEAELEKQLAQFDTESQILKSSLSREERRSKELEAELERVRMENLILEKQLAEANQVLMQANVTNLHNRVPTQTIQRTPNQGWPEVGTPGACSPLQNSSVMGTSVAKIVQPTATVSSVPVSGPTTGVARSISPGHGLRTVPYSQQITPVKVDKRLVANNVLTPSSKPNASSPNQKPVSTLYGAANGNSDKKGPMGRGVPPPVPPNKPIVPPKKDSVLSRRPDVNSIHSVGDASKGLAKDAKMSDGHDQDPSDYQNLPSSSQTGLV